jgi:hypothetical protein
VLYTEVKRNDYRKTLLIGRPEWKEAGALNDRDTLLYPIITETKDREKIRISDILQAEIEEKKVKNHQETYTSHRLFDEIPIDKEFLRLTGYYLAEGGLGRQEVNFYFNKKEKEYINDVENLIRDLVSLKVHLKTEGEVVRISVFSKLLRDLFHLLYGKGAPNKKIPQWMLFLPLEKQKELIKGLYKGDGCRRDKDFCIVTTSRILAYQIRDILLRFKIVPSIEKREKAKLNKLPGEIGGRKIRFNNDKYHIVIGGASLGKMSEILGIHHHKLDERKRVCNHAWFDDNYLYLPIRKIEKENYKGRVYNLVVDKNNTYVTKNFIVHNCDGPLFKDKTVAVVGGGDCAIAEALHLALFAKKVYLIHRRGEFRAEPAWIEKLEKEPKIEKILENQVMEIKGTERVKEVALEKPYKESNSLPLDGVFVEIGHIPSSVLTRQLGVELNDDGYVKITPEMETNVLGVFAAGDLVEMAGRTIFRQLIAASADGARAAASVYHYLRKNTPSPSWGRKVSM